MVGTRDLAELVRHAEAAGAKLVLIGDHAPLPGSSTPRARADGDRTRSALGFLDAGRSTARRSSAYDRGR
jgi:hypothetical protein